MARRLDVALVEFPGNHVGPTGVPREFAASLRAVLAEA
jgi:hypothetical protein